MVVDQDRPRLTERDFDSMSRAELWQAYQKLERYNFLKKTISLDIFSLRMSSSGTYRENSSIESRLQLLSYVLL